MLNTHIFGLHIPTTAPNVPSEVLDPRKTWSDGDAYDAMATELAINSEQTTKNMT